LSRTFAGYSIGRWVDEDGDGRHETLEVETRGFKGPRAYDEADLPLNFDNQSIFRERNLSRQGRSKYYSPRDHNDRPCPDASVDGRTKGTYARAVWPEYYIAEDNGQIAIGNENYFLSAEGILCRPRKIRRAPICGISKKRAGDGSLASANLEGSDQQRKTIARDSR
jgi:hypothetical protein